MIPKEINLSKCKFQSQNYITGHYDFEIEVLYEDNSKKQIFRRYSEIRALYKTLILKCPGCLIPNIPSKSIWMQINYESQEQINERMDGIREFLSYLVKHKILRKNKEVIYFFSTSYKRKDGSSSNKDNSNKNKAKDDSDDDIDISSAFDAEKEEDFNENDKNKNDNDDDIEPLKEFVEEYNNKNKGIMTKGKKLIGNMFNYIKTYTTSNTNKEEEEDNNINNNKNTYNLNDNANKKFNKEDDEFIKKKKKELGEDFEINDYNEKINRLNVGVINIIQNIEKLMSINIRKNQALENIVNNDKNFKNLMKSLDNEKNNSFTIEGDDDEEEEKSKNKINSHKNNICKIGGHYKIQNNFINKKIDQNLINIKKYQILLTGLLDIYSRKKEHIYYLARLHSQKTELEKQKELNNNISPTILKKKEDELKTNINHQIKFINKINKDLKYEIEKYKNNQEDIYLFINSLFKDKANILKESIENLNKENFEEYKDDNDYDDDKNKKGKSKYKEYIDENQGDDF